MDLNWYLIGAVVGFGGIWYKLRGIEVWLRDIDTELAELRELIEPNPSVRATRHAARRGDE
jgi:hypothetical protein